MKLENGGILTEFSSMLERLGVTVDAAPQKKMLSLIDLLLDANQHINLTAITDRDEAIEKHLLDSLLPLAFWDVPDGARCLDIGTGAGFPGLPLAIACPQAQFTLMDATKKKLIFIENALKTLDIHNVQLVHGRAEEAAHGAMRQQFDLVTARAVAALPILLEYTLPFVCKDGFVWAYKGPEASAEAEACQKALRILGGNLRLCPPLTLPMSQSIRVIVCVQKRGATPAEYPRREAIIRQQPLR